MKKERRNLKSAAILTGALVTGTFAGLHSVNAENSSVFEYEAMGSGAEVRSELLAQNNIGLNAADAINSVKTVKFSEMKCGEGTCGSEKKDGDTKKKDAKVSEKKSAESTCGDDKKSGDKKSASKKDSKAAESKCGEGKCG